jgi:hypothetical protein
MSIKYLENLLADRVEKDGLGYGVVWDRAVFRCSKSLNTVLTKNCTFCTKPHHILLDGLVLDKF